LNKGETPTPKFGVWGEAAYRLCSLRHQMHGKISNKVKQFLFY